MFRLCKKHEGKKRGQMGQEAGRRGRGQRRRPSSKASLDAAASSPLSVGSQPPLGTVDRSSKIGRGGNVCGTKMGSGAKIRA